jgi:REP element-mobilizing transposase RayT
MTYPRKTLISLNDTPYYHLVGRCVRRAWLWGVDEYSGRDYSHRKEWVLERLRLLSAVFAIDICAYAIMSNHYHLVVHVNRSEAQGWTSREVIDRWCQLYSAPPVIQRWLEGAASQAECELAEGLITRWRSRLCDVSWYMRALNEYLARRANAEDQCKGRFWEGRFRSQALLDEAGLLTAMAYVDLNPVRANIAATPEESEFTSIYRRIRELRVLEPAQTDGLTRTAAPDRSSLALMPFADEVGGGQPSIPYAMNDYLLLVDWTGRVLRADKRGAISAALPPILRRLNIDEQVWTRIMRPSGNVFGRAMGRVDRMRLHAQALGQARTGGLSTSKQLYG